MDSFTFAAFMKKATTVNNKSTMLIMVSLLICLVSFSNYLFSFPCYSESLNEVASDGELVFEQKSDHLPVYPFETPEELPVQDKLESKDECNDEISKLFANLSHRGSQIRHTNKHRLLQLQIGIENRSSVSLFVLYHCWKSLPSLLNNI